MYCLYCENCFCIYYQHHLCRLDHICLDIHGRCASCILIELEEPLMQEKREKLLKRYQDEEAAWQPPTVKKASK